MASNSLPLQKIPKSEKNRDWKVNCGKALSGSKYGNLGSHSKGQYNQIILDKFKIAAGKLHKTSYTHITNPFNLTGEQYKRYPEKLRNYDFLSPLFQKQVSRFLKAPFNPVVYTKNSNFENEKLQKEKELINESLQQRFINKLIETGQIKEANQVQELSPDQIQSQINSMKDIDTITGQKVLDYVIQRDNIKMHYAKEFYHFLVSNKCYSFSTVRNDNIIRYTVHPASLDYSYVDTPLIGNANVIRVRYRFNYEDIIELFQDHPDLEYYPNFLNHVESQSSDRRFNGLVNTDGYDNESNNYLSDLTDIQHIQWTSFRKVGILGEIEVDEDYQGYVDKWTWREEIREIFIVNDEYYFGGDCLDYPIYDSNNPFKAKKSYEGVVFMNDIVEQETLVDKLIQYQEAYNVCKYKIQVLIAKYKGKIGVIPIGLISGKGSGVVSETPSNFVVDVDDDGDDKKYISSQEEMDRLSKNDKPLDKDTPEQKALYRMDATNLLFVDESSETAALAIQMLKSIDLSDGNMIQFLMQYCDSIKAEAIELMGLNRFAQGDIGNRESVGNVQEGLAQAGEIVDLYYYFFEIYIASDLQRILDYTKHAFKEGTNITYLRSARELESLKIPKKYGNTSYGIFVDDSRKAQQIMGLMESKATEMLQNNNKMSTVLKMLSSSKNYSSIIEDIEKAEQQFRAEAEAQQQAQLESQQQIEQLKSTDKQADRDLKKYEIDTKAEIAIQQATMQALSFENASNETADYGKIAEQQEKALQRLADFQLKNRELSIKEKDVEVKKYVADKQLSVAKANKG